MLVADSYVGHRRERAVRERLDGTDPHRVELTDTERRRSRVRTETVEGRDLGVVVGRDLADGDVLATEDGALVVVTLADVAVLAISLADGQLAPRRALALGHALGNRHLDLAIRGERALAPAGEEPERRRETIDALVPEDVEVVADTASPAVFDDDRGADRGPDHSHGAGHEDDHSHGAGHEDDHAHGADHEHGHDHHGHDHHGHDDDAEQTPAAVRPLAREHTGESDDVGGDSP